MLGNFEMMAKDPVGGAHVFGPEGVCALRHLTSHCFSRHPVWDYCEHLTVAGTEVEQLTWVTQLLSSGRIPT